MVCRVCEGFVQMLSLSYLERHHPSLEWSALTANRRARPIGEKPGQPARYGRAAGPLRLPEWIIIKDTCRTRCCAPWPPAIARAASPWLAMTGCGSP